MPEAIEEACTTEAAKRGSKFDRDAVVPKVPVLHVSEFLMSVDSMIRFKADRLLMFGINRPNEVVVVSLYAFTDKSNRKLVVRLSYT